MLKMVLILIISKNSASHQEADFFCVKTGETNETFETNETEIVAMIQKDNENLSVKLEI